MPEFIDLFQGILKERNVLLKERLNVGRQKALTSQKFQEIFLQNYLPLHNLPNPQKGTFFAIDGSFGQRELANGYVFYVSRALGISNIPSKEQHLIADVFTFSTGRKKTSSYITLKSEYCEFHVVHKLLSSFKAQTTSNKNNVILIDGSLYGRVMHPPIESNVLGDGEFSLKYLELYADVLKLAQETNTLLVGISKDSNASFFRNQILDLVLDDELKRLQKIISKSESEFLFQLVKNVDDLNPSVFQRYLTLFDKYPTELNCFNEILDEYLNNQTDNALILEYAKFPGFTQPMELGPARQRPIVIFNQILQSPVFYLQKRFRHVIIEKQKEKVKDQFMPWAVNVLKRYMNLPTFVSFHLLPRIGDTPMRVDIPSYEFGSTNVLKDFQRTDFLTGECLDKTKAILAFLMDQYVDFETYNVFLKTVDLEVKLSRGALDLYEQAMADRLDVLIHHTRDFRRVKFP
ncbi:MAG: hypothetical protein RBG13Loki_1532 [Promethearchaeota archaeon CR_4]|nr:MAG: hypothetical protein RBG13Loki_1532 [Candidatus Lokiarchaeota archaeon CR_4]